MARMRIVVADVATPLQILGRIGLWAVPLHSSLMLSLGMWWMLGEARNLCWEGSRSARIGYW